MIEFLHVNLKDSDIINNTIIYRQKSSILIRDFIKPVLYEEIAKILSNKKFSIILDETTEINKLKFLAILMQFWDDNKSLTVMLHSIIDYSLKQEPEDLY